MDDAEVFARRANSFGARAAAYAEHRPDYPVDGIRWALAGASRTVGEVLDLAAGTGKLTDGLVSLGVAVTAVEPDAAMRAELSSRMPEVTALEGTAERIPLPAASVDAVLVGQAFHWFDADRALTEIARVLRPGGVVGALWNFEDDTVDWVAGLGALARSSVSREWNVDDLPAPEVFDPFERAVFSHSHRRTAQSLADTIGTHSHTMVISETERAELLGRVLRYLRSRPETAHGEFDLPLQTTVVRARVRT